MAFKKPSNVTPFGNTGEVSFTLEVFMHNVTSNHNDLTPASYDGYILWLHLFITYKSSSMILRSME